MAGATALFTVFHGSSFLLQGPKLLYRLYYYYNPGIETSRLFLLSHDAIMALAIFLVGFSTTERRNRPTKVKMDPLVHSIVIITGTMR